MSTTEFPLYLASQSPRRRELLAQIGVPHGLVRVDVPEFPNAGEAALDYVQRLARSKAAAGFAVLGAKAAVLGADTLGLLDDQILEKPRDLDDAIAMLGAMSGRTHQVISAVAIHTPALQACRYSITQVSFRAITEAEIRAYWETGEPRDKAGSYGIQGLGAVFVRELQGSYSGVVGLPLEITCELLAAANIGWWQTPETDL